LNSPKNNSNVSFDRPVIIIGAGRSGTNMLRDILCEVPGFATWPCDEINYIWRHGNREFATDEFTREMADEKTANYIRKQFSSFAKRHPGATVVEKTCANSLRCGFIHEIFPSARFIHIYRDGRDVAASASLRWNAKLDIGYILKKAKYVPWSDLPYYGSRYLSARVFKLTSGKSRLSTWGPKFDGMQDAFANHELPVGCAIQWKRCVELARHQLEQIPTEQVLNIRYEDFTANPEEEFEKVIKYLGAGTTSVDLADLTKGVSNRSVGKWTKQLTESQLEEIILFAGELLSELGYH
jgi:hypothetical protein